MSRTVVNNSFDVLMRKQRKGAFMHEVSEALTKTVQSARENKKRATLTIKIEVEPANGDATALSITDDVQTKLPKPKRQNGLFYATDYNQLCIEDPRQGEMELTVQKSAEPEKNTDASNAIPLPVAVSA